MKKVCAIVAAVLVLDQALKIWVKTHMTLGEDIPISDWFIIHFTENPGMAFGMELGGSWGKLILSLFRIITVGVIVYWIKQLLRRPHLPGGALIAVSLILAGAIGNILDSAFYGLLFSDSLGQPASFLPAQGGYAGFLYGHVVDMFYFPLYRGYLPEWLPFWGGDYFVFFRPVFNIADFSISLGVGLLLLFQKAVFQDSEEHTPASR